MIDIPVYGLDGKQVDTLQLDEALLGGEVRPHLLKQAYVMYHANRRQGTSATKGRGDVAGSTRKLYRQKGTGRARRGAIRTNVLRGGGVAFAKSPKDWRQAMPVKMRRLATRNALLAKAVDGEIKVIDGFSFEAPKTRQFVQVLDTLGIERSCLVAVDPGDQHVSLSARNVQGVTTLRAEQLNVFDLLNHRYLLVERGVLEAYLAPAASQSEEAA